MIYTRLAAPQSRAGQALTLREKWMSAGLHQVTFDGSSLPSGLYFYRLAATEGPFRAGQNTAAGKMVLLK